MYSLTSYSKNLRGTAPHCNTTSWKSLISNLSPANKILINFKNNEVAEFFVSINPSIFLLLFNVLASYKLYPLLGRFFNLRGNLVNFEKKKWKQNFSSFHKVFIPSALLAFFLSCFNFNSPTLYAQACPGKVTYRLHSTSSILGSMKVFSIIKSKAWSKDHLEKNDKY